MGKSGNPAKAAKAATSQSNNQIMLTWCDNGTVDGKFTEGVVYAILTSELPITSAQRVQGNQIGRQREVAFNTWHKKTDFDWILWVDSDIVLTNEALKKIWESADPVTRPVVSGTYFISKEMERNLMSPYPTLFNVTDDKYKIEYVHPLPKNELIKVDYAGFGFLLMHRIVADTMRRVHGNKPLFMETLETSGDGGKDTFIGEDIQFFMNMKEAGIPLHAHTGATVKHMKRFSFDEEYYKLYWVTHAIAQVKEKGLES